MKMFYVFGLILIALVSVGFFCTPNNEDMTSLQQTVDKLYDLQLVTAKEVNDGTVLLKGKIDSLKTTVNYLSGKLYLMDNVMDIIVDRVDGNAFLLDTIIQNLQSWSVSLSQIEVNLGKLEFEVYSVDTLVYGGRKIQIVWDNPTDPRFAGVELSYGKVSLSKIWLDLGNVEVYTPALLDTGLNEIKLRAYVCISDTIKLIINGEEHSYISKYYPKSEWSDPLLYDCR